MFALKNLTCKELKYFTKKLKLYACLIMVLTYADPAGSENFSVN